MKTAYGLSHILTTPSPGWYVRVPGTPRRFFADGKYPDALLEATRYRDAMLHLARPAVRRKALAWTRPFPK